MKLGEKIDFFCARLFGKMKLGVQAGKHSAQICFIWHWRGHDYTMSFPVPNETFKLDENEHRNDALQYAFPGMKKPPGVSDDKRER